MEMYIIKHVQGGCLYSGFHVSFKKCVEDAVNAGVDLAFADLWNADLRKANLYYANFRDVNLSHANLRCADLRCADLRHADLDSTCLQGANLRGADLRWADLRASDLSEVDLRDADLEGAVLGELNLYKADLRGANLNGVDLRNVDLTRVNLYEEDLTTAITNSNQEDITMSKPSVLTNEPVDVNSLKITSADLTPIEDDTSPRGYNYLVDADKIKTIEDVQLFIKIAAFHISDNDPNFEEAKPILKDTPLL